MKYSVWALFLGLLIYLYIEANGGMEKHTVRGIYLITLCVFSITMVVYFWRVNKWLCAAFKGLVLFFAVAALTNFSIIGMPYYFLMGFLGLIFVLPFFSKK